MRATRQTICRALRELSASSDTDVSVKVVGVTGIEPVTPAMSTPRNKRKNKSLG
jgi:hypothetical protein